MSLKAKLEAVIYAAEEPVTLAQLAALFTADALEWKAEQEAAAAASRPGRGPQPRNRQCHCWPRRLESLGLEADAGRRRDSPRPKRLPPSRMRTFRRPQPKANPRSGCCGVRVRLRCDAGLPRGSARSLKPRRRRAARQRDREVRAILRQLLDELIADYASDDRGVEIREIAGGYRMATKPECHDAVRLFIKSLKPALKLSLPALETLAVIAYKQPVTAPEVNEIRGVDSSGVLRFAAGAQAHRHGGPQAGDRPAHPLQDHQGVPAALRPEGRHRAAFDGRVREDGGHRTGRTGVGGQEEAGIRL